MAIVTLTPDAAEQLDALNNPIHGRVLKLQVAGSLGAMARCERRAKPLSGELAGRYRLRTGDFRVQLYVEGENVIVEKIGHRDRFYDE